MKVLDLFAGLEGWSQPFRERGHEVISLDFDPAFGCDITADILEWNPADLPWRPDIILASPPCEAFSVMTIGHHWTGGRRAYEPKTEHAKVSMEVVRKTVGIILQTMPTYWVIENPRGVLRKLGLIPVEPETIWACHFGAQWAKPTDLWGRLPARFTTRGKCHNQRPEHPADCCCRDHPSAPRGARAGIQGVGGLRHSRLGEAGHTTAAERAKIPSQLAYSMMVSAEMGLSVGGRARGDHVAREAMAV